MTNLKFLLTNNFKILINRFRGKRQQKTFIGGALTLCLGVVALVSLYSYQAKTIFDGLGKSGLNDLCIFHAFIITLSVMIIVGVMRVSGKPVDSDKDLLMSLPIKKSEIVASKIINYYLYDLFFSALLLLPYIVLYQVNTSFSAYITIIGLLIILILPLLSVGISCIMNFIINRLFNRMKSGVLIKSFISVLIYIIVMSLMLLKTFGYGKVQANTMEEYFSDRFFSNMFLKFLINRSFTSGLLAILTCVLPFIIGICLFYEDYGKTFSKFTAKKKTVNFEKGKSEFGILLKKEIMSYLYTPAWVVNSVIGPIFVVAIGILISIGQFDKIFNIYGDINTKVLLAILILAINFMNSTSIISCCSISLEGKNVWLLKSSPINENLLFLSKVMTHIIISMPSTLFSSILIIIKLKASIAESLLFIGICCVFVLVCAVSGVFINLIFPQLDYSDETKVIKQSMSSLVFIFSGIIIALIPLILYLILDLSVINLGVITLCTYLIILFGVTFALFTKGKTLFKKLAI